MEFGPAGTLPMNETGLSHKLAAILAADAAGYSRLMSIDERATLAALEAARTVFRQGIDSHQGRVVDMAGDSVLAVFGTATGAVAAALGIQTQVNALAEDSPEDRRMLFRIGVHLGEVIEKPDGTVYGDGVNIAARLQALAEPGGITASDAVHGAVRGKVGASFQDQGSQAVKNIAEPVRAWGLCAPGLRSADPALRSARSSSARDAPASNLPARPTRLIGRAAELAQAREQLRSHRLVTITGVGGALIFAIGIDLLGIRRLPTGNMLPAIIVGAVLGGLLG